MNPLIDRFEAMLADGKDDALLRFGLGQAYLKQGDPARARTHLSRAVEHDPNYSAAWKLLGRACLDDGDKQAAAVSYQRGIEVAEQRGDKQAAREMQVFLKRLQRE